MGILRMSRRSSGHAPKFGQRELTTRQATAAQNQDVPSIRTCTGLTKHGQDFENVIYSHYPTAVDIFGA